MVFCPQRHNGWCVPAGNEGYWWAEAPVLMSALAAVHAVGVRSQTRPRLSPAAPFARRGIAYGGAM